MNLKWQIAQAAEIRWWQFYLRSKTPEHYLEQKRAYWCRVLEQVNLVLPDQGRVLDAGCGPAGIFLILEGLQVDAVDPLLEAYETKLAHFSRSDYPWVHFFPSPLEKFQPTQPYQLIFCLNAINHVADLEQSVDHLIDALQIGGQLLLSIDVHKNKFLKTTFRLFPGDILHPHQHELADYINLLTSRGCRITQTCRLKSGAIFDYFMIIALKEPLTLL